MILSMRNVSFAYDRGPHVLEGLTFDVAKGALHLIVGPSGTGKSTLLQLMAGLLKPDGGEIKTQLGRDSVGSTLVFQYPERHFFHRTVKDELSFGLRRMKLGDDQIETRINDCFELLGLSASSLLPQSPFRLSGGEQRLIAVAVGLVLRPELLLLDEPAAGLDSQARHRLFTGLDEWRRRYECTMMIVSHDMSGIAERADQILALNNGNLLFSGPPGDFFNQPSLCDEMGLRLPLIQDLMRQLSPIGLVVEKPDGGRIETMEEAAELIAEAIRQHRSERGH